MVVSGLEIRELVKEEVVGGLLTNLFEFWMREIQEKAQPITIYRLWTTQVNLNLEADFQVRL